MAESDAEDGAEAGEAKGEAEASAAAGAVEEGSAAVAGASREEEEEELEVVVSTSMASSTRSLGSGAEEADAMANAELSDGPQRSTPLSARQHAISTGGSRRVHTRTIQHAHRLVSTERRIERQVQRAADSRAVSGVWSRRVTH